MSGILDTLDIKAVAARVDALLAILCPVEATRPKPKVRKESIDLGTCGIAKDENGLYCLYNGDDWADWVTESTDAAEQLVAEWWTEQLNVAFAKVGADG